MLNIFQGIIFDIDGVYWSIRERLIRERWN
jgi:hypothetical protein